MAHRYDIIVIGGSAGSIMALKELLHNIEDNVEKPILLCLHRLKSGAKGMLEAIGLLTNREVIEPNDKQSICRSKVYLSPANYHLTMENRLDFALDVSEPVHQSRPSIDIGFKSVAYAYHTNVLGIVLSGANSDGIEGAKTVKLYGGTVLVQDPKTCEIETLTKGVVDQVKVDYVLSVKEIAQFINNFC